MAAERREFHIDGPLPHGLTVVEASAGTGKTYALSSLAARFVAERDVPMSGLCLVTFTEAATAELRSRVRARLVEAADGLERLRAAGHAAVGVHPADSVPTADPLIAILADVDDPELDRRISRLRTAVNDFDAATVSTIHGLCARLLAMSGDSLGEVSISRDSSDVHEVVNDVLIAAADPASGVTLPTTVTPKAVLDAVKVALQLPDAVMQRASDPADDARLSVIADLVDEVVATVVARRAAARRRTLDRTVVDTRDLVAQRADSGFVTAIRQRYRVVLIDEFQDTDTVQWDLFRRAFVGGEGAPTVVLVGDPKQSIYRFRGAELSAYLAAVQEADEVLTLGCNWRSDAAVLAGLERLFGGFSFGDPTVVFQPVAAAPGNAGWRLQSPRPDAAPVEVRPTVAPGPKLGSDEARAIVLADVVNTVAELLGAGSGIRGDDGVVRPLRARDIAVLTRTNGEASTVVAQLSAAGIAAASSGATDVFASDAWPQWQILLAALERPTAPGAARAAALGWFGGLDAARLDALDDAGVTALHDRWRRWAELLATGGVPALMSAARHDGVHARVLARSGGERHLTDLEHLAELLHLATHGSLVSAGALRRLVADPAIFGDPRDAESVRMRRIDRDDDAVQVLTAHRAKGLEFGVVLCPFLWGKPQSDDVVHGVVDGQRRIALPALLGASRSPHPLQAAATAEAGGEQRRLLYVALTRAKHQCIVWWAPVTMFRTSAVALADLLAHAVDGPRPSTPAHLEPLVTPGALGVRAVARSVATQVAPSVDTRPLAVAAAHRTVDRAWRVWSFSAITAAADRHDFDVPPTGGSDEPPALRSDLDDVEADRNTGRPVHPLATAPAGTEFGTLVHRVLERIDFASATLLDDLVAECGTALAHRTLRVDATNLAAGLHTAIEAPLGGPLGPLRLRDLTRADRLDELTFDMPLGRVRARQIGAVLATHLPADDPLAGWASAVASGAFDFPVAGMLTGSIDLVARSSGGRYWVADYKTNRLPTGSTYTRADLATAMAKHHYPLQAALYLVALHRYLHWRLPGYRPADHLSGAAYLFVRGMQPGEAVVAPPGVFWWHPPVAAVEALDALLGSEVAS